MYYVERRILQLLGHRVPHRMKTSLLSADFLVPLRVALSPSLAPPPWGGAPSLPTTTRAFLSSKWTATLPVLWTRAPQWWPQGLNHCSLSWPRWPARPTFKVDYPMATTFLGTSQSCFACPPKPLDQPLDTSSWQSMNTSTKTLSLPSLTMPVGRFTFSRAQILKCSFNPTSSAHAMFSSSPTFPPT
jgi:hypothetical protein